MPVARVSSFPGRVRDAVLLPLRGLQARMGQKRVCQRIGSPRTFCLFVGYPRSGHTLVGALLNAHPKMLISHEADVLRYVHAGFEAERLYYVIHERDRWFTHRRDSMWCGYSFAVPSQWQGRWRDLEVIGDKKGGLTTLWLRDHPELLERLRATVRLPIKLVHIVRNPFDSITTIAKRTGRGDLDASSDYYFEHAAAIHEIRKRIPAEDWFESSSEEVVRDARGVLRRLCRFLGVEPGADYLEACAGMVFESPRLTRTKLPWSEEQRRRVQDRLAQYEFLAHYRFDA